MSSILHLLKIVVTLLFYLGLTIESANAAVNRQLNYGFTSEYNSDKDDRNFSDLRLNIDDDFYSSRFDGAYDLESSFFADHENNDSNDQHRGQLTSQYKFANPRARWNMDAMAEVLPVERDSETDEFNSQTMTRISTGPEILLGRGMRGSTNLSAQVTKVNFSEAGSDSIQYETAVIYSYPISSNVTTGFDISYRSLDYDDSADADSDFDVASVGGFYTSRSRSIEFNANANFNEARTDGNTTEQNTYGLDVLYLINSFSSLSVSLTDSLQTSDEFDSLPGNQENSLFEAGVFRNQRLAIGYQYTFGDFSTSTEIFTNQIDNLDSSLEEDDEINGWSTNLSYEINQNLRTSALFRRTETDSTGIDDDEVELLIAYTKIHSRTLSSEFMAFYEYDSSYENDGFDGSELNNPGLRYRLNALLF